MVLKQINTIFVSSCFPYNYCENVISTVVDTNMGKKNYLIHLNKVTSFEQYCYLLFDSMFYYINRMKSKCICAISFHRPFASQ